MKTLAWISFPSLLVLFPVACSSSSGGSANTTADASFGDAQALADAPSFDGGSPGDAAPPPADGGVSSLALSCAATKMTVAPNPCPTPIGGGMASFCYRPGWAGVTSVDVYGSFGQSTDWKMPLLTLTNDGSGTFTGTASLSNGTYAYLYRTHGGADGLVRDGQYFLDQYNAQFVPSPPGSPSYSPNSPVPRSVSAVTVPQTPLSVVHLKGTVLFNGAPQPCFSIDLEAGEVTANGVAKQEHNTANYAESGLDGTFDFPVVAGPYGVSVRYPFLLAGLDAGYPDPSVTPAAGIARSGANVTTGDRTFDPVDMAYPDYAAMAPTGSSANNVALPATFTFTVIPGAAAAAVAVIGTNIAGNDALYMSPYGTATSLTWDGGFGGKAGSAMPGTRYYWGAWQEHPSMQDGGTSWAAESLLFPITFQ